MNPPHNHYRSPYKPVYHRMATMRGRLVEFCAVPGRVAVGLYCVSGLGGQFGPTRQHTRSNETQQNKGNARAPKCTVCGSEATWGPPAIFERRPKQLVEFSDT
jgi:hypothetical protein